MKKFIRQNAIYFIAILGIIFALLTYNEIINTKEELTQFTYRSLFFILCDIILLLTLAALAISKIAQMLVVRRSGDVGYRLQTRIVLMFSLLAVVPTIVVAAFSIFYSVFVINSWFSDKIGTALNSSVTVAKGYMQEHENNIRGDALAMARDLNNQALSLTKNQALFNRTTQTQAAIRDLSDAIIFKNKKILARTNFSLNIEFEMEQLKDEHLKRAASGEMVVFINSNGDRIRALIKLYDFDDTYMLIGRFIDSNLLRHMLLSQKAASEYNNLLGRLSSQQIQFMVIFVCISLLLLLGALWIGLRFADKITKPIANLIDATRKVKDGDLTVQICEGRKNDEIDNLGRSFNSMIGKLRSHNSEMNKVNKLLEERRRLIEDVLAGVSSGVIALNKSRHITLFNISAPKLLSANDNNLNNTAITEIFPEISTMLKQASLSTKNLLQEEMSITRNDKKYCLIVRVIVERAERDIIGFIVTFDDITELQTAQRSAAWSGVARRIAHEIKNPLTPIQLSMERLRSKFSKNLEEKDAESFHNYIDIISRNTEIIKEIVEEFSNFARMPTPKMREENIHKIISNVVSSEKIVNPKIIYNITGEEGYMLDCDNGQMVQILTNLLKNSKESISNSKNIDEGVINIDIAKNSQNASNSQNTHASQNNSDDNSTYLKIEITDNGCGFPENLIDKITEPYVTTREKGTGLGLAIVAKVIDDHKGKLQIQNLTNNNGDIIGADIQIFLPI